MTTRAVPADDGGYILNGAKMWITNGTIADVAVVWAKLPDGVVGGFLVEKGMPGFTAPEIRRKMSLRASVTSELIFDDVHIPAENRLPDAHGLKCPLSCLTQARYGIAWGAIGAALDCFECALVYQKARPQFGRPLASFQLQQAKFADMLTDITAAQLIALRLARLKDEGRMHHAQVSLAKRNNVMTALRIAREARQMLGASGITLDYPVIRHMTNLESVVTYEGAHDIHTLVLGEAVTGIGAFG
jgi:glutaryl-CoA dehydrogenase